MTQLPTRKHCSKCRRWLLCCINFRVAEKTPDKQGVKRLQSQCNSCARETTRVSQGRRRRGFRYEAQTRQTAEQKAAARRWRYKKRAQALRKDDRLVPLKPFSEWLEHKAQEIGIANLANEMRMDASQLGRLIAGVNVVTADRIGGLVRPKPVLNGRTTVVVKQVDIRLAIVDEALIRFEESVWDLYPALFDE